MLKNTFCPNLTWRSFVAIISLIDIGIFITFFIGSLVIYGDLSHT